MHNAPEGLSYGTDNYKYAKADKLESELEKGKYTTGATPPVEAERAETLRMLHEGSQDPMYKHKGKNK